MQVYKNDMIRIGGPYYFNKGQFSGVLNHNNYWRPLHSVWKWLIKVSFYNIASFKEEKVRVSHYLKLLKMSHLKFSILAFFINFCPIKSDLSGNRLTTCFKLAKLNIFGTFNELLSTQNVAFEVLNFGIFHQFLSF